ncbi:40s ribosomal protein s6-b [Mycena pura]|uniref:40S ribosomal protein S6 n=1 Tax=Mycena pura TaxID=153505 RepID=A0AAD6VUH2_9AGAR|nr:40s ribosomal protein s6-b [Mycena pura]
MSQSCIATLCNLLFSFKGPFQVVDPHELDHSRVFYDKKIAQEVPADSLGLEWAGYVLRITGGNDKQGFPTVSSACWRTATRATAHAAPGEGEITGLTDNVLPKRLGPKRASKIKRFFNLSKDDDVRKYVVRREVTGKKEGAKPYTKAPKIQRPVTPMRLQRRRHLKSLVRRRTDRQKEQKAEYDVLIAKRLSDKEAKAAAFKAAHHKPTTA